MALSFCFRMMNKQYYENKGGNVFMNEELIAPIMYSALFLTGSVIILEKVCEYAIRSYERKCNELKMAKDVIKKQKKEIKRLLKENED